MSRKKQEKKKSPLPLFIIFGVLAVAVVAGVMLMGSNRSAGTQQSAAGTQQQRQQQAANRRATVPPGAEPPQAKGRPEAPVMIEEFGDYQCPPCGFLHPIINKLQGQYGERVYFVFRHLPLQSIHRNAALAARSAEAAGLQGKFWGMHDLLFEHQDEWKDQPDPRPTFSGYAQRLGLDVEKFRADIDSPQVSARIAADVRRATAIGATGTPTVFINGMQVQSFTESDLRRDIDAAMSAQPR